MTPPRPCVAIYRNQLLPLSQTFIRDQARTMQRFRPVFVGRELAGAGLDLRDFDVRLAGAAGGLRSTLGRVLPTLRPLPRVLRAAGAALVHAHFGTDAVDAWPDVRRLGIPMFVTLHGFDIHTSRQWWEAGHGGKRRVRYPRELLEMAQDPLVRFLAVSRAVRARAIAFGLPEARVTLSYIGVDTRRFAPTPSHGARARRRILFVGRMVEKKDPVMLVRAFARVSRRLPGATLAMVGDGPLLEEAQREAAALGESVEFTGALPDTAVLAQLHRADVFCLPSRVAASGDAEGLPISILEALACGVPVATSAVGGVDEGIDQGRVGIAFAEGDVAALADALVRLLDDDELASRLSREGRRYVAEHFGLEDCTARLEALYAEALAPGHSS